MSAFHLLRLPLVAMEHVLYMMNPHELFNISLISSRSKRSVKCLPGIKHKFRIYLGFSVEEPYVVFVRPQPPAASWAITWVLDESKAGYEEDDRDPRHFHASTDKYSENPTEDLMKCYEYIKEVFGCPIDNVYFNLNSFPSQNKQIIDWIRSQQQTINKIEVEDTEGGFEEDLEYLLDNITITIELKISFKRYKSGFQVEIPTTPWHLIIKNASFMDFEQLLRLKNPSISLNHSILSSQEINQFVKSWMAMKSHLNLETFEINVSGPEAMNVIMLLPFKIADSNHVKKLGRNFHTPETKERFCIARCDGKVATLCYGRSSLGHRFFMLTH